jgi:hypothetical protein
VAQPQSREPRIVTVEAIHLGASPTGRGINADILGGGIIRVGDPVVEL